MGQGRKWVKRVALTACTLGIATGVYVGLNWKSVNARYAGYQFQRAKTPDDRTKWAQKLVAQGAAGSPYLMQAFRDGDTEQCSTVVTVVKDELNQISPQDPRYAERCRPFLDGLGTFSDSGKLAVADLVPELLKCPEADVAPRCRDAIRSGLTSSHSESKIRSIRLALRPELGLHSDVVPLLNDADAEVRRAALLAVGPISPDGSSVIGDEELFHWLHDPDAVVRELCESALKSRGLDEEQIQLARQLTDPDPTERLKLLNDLRWARSNVKDPGPWLERLSRDPDPAIRLGSARVAYECKLLFSSWLDRMVVQDPDPTVRKWAAYYRGLSTSLKQAGFTPDR